jgi:hypothetical protein
MDYAEDMQFDPSDEFSQFTNQEKYRGLQSPEIAAGDTDFHIYAQITKEYSSRGLTQESDIMNALAGIWKVMENIFPHSAFIINMPLAILDAALLWHPMAPLARRTCLIDSFPIPLWSWAGWIGPVHYFEATVNAVE